MPNWPLNWPAKNMLTQKVYALSQRPLGFVLGEFPLTTAQIQAMVLTEKQVELLRDLERDGFRTIEHHNQVRLLFHRDRLPRLQRHAVIVVHGLPTWIFAKRNTASSFQKTDFRFDETGYLVPDMQVLDGSERDKFVTWLNKAVRQTRLTQIANHTGDRVISEYVKTAAHLRGIWPTLATVFADAKQQSTQHRRLEESDWAERFRNLPKATEPYEPDPKVHARFKPFMDVADSVFLSAMLTGPYNRPAGKPIVSVEHWEKRAGDPVLPT